MVSSGAWQLFNVSVLMPLDPQHPCFAVPYLALSCLPPTGASALAPACPCRYSAGAAATLRSGSPR
mgnify:CR=1 FL=1